MVLSSSSVHLLLSLLLHLIVIAVKSSDVVPQMSDISNYVPSVGEELWEEHYVTSCPNMQTIIQSKIDEWTAKDPTLAPSLIRLHYMDCAVRVSLIIYNCIYAVEGELNHVKYIYRDAMDRYCWIIPAARGLHLKQED